MLRHRALTCLLLAAAIAASAASAADQKQPATQPATQATTPPTTRPATRPATQPTTTKAAPNVPAQLVLFVRSRFSLPREGLPQEKIIERMEEVLRLGAEIERKYAGAKNLAVIQLSMMRASDWLARKKQDPAYVETLKRVGKRILASAVPADEKAVADYFLTRVKLRPPVGKAAVKDVPAAIRGLAAKYAKTDAAATGLIYAIVLAHEAGQAKLREELADKLASGHLNEPGVRPFLRGQLGRHPDIGKPFEAELTRLDGTKLSLPKDLLGKVVVVDFWAAWCGPCVRALPEMKRLYAKYKDKGVEFVGISLDKSRKKLTDLITTEKLNWIQTCSFLFWDDPTVRKYGVEGIPNIWVVGRDGRIVSDRARANLDATIRKALRTPAPAKKP